MVLAPSGAPKFLSNSSANLTSITIHWSDMECFDQNSEISGFAIKIRESTDFNSTTASTAADENMFTMSGLLPSTEYTIEIAAQGANKTGPYNSITISTLSPTGIRM